MDYSELVKSLRICVKSTDCIGCIKNDDGTEFGCKPLGDSELVLDAADAIEELLHILCGWCGVCPESRRKPYDCEIIFPNAPVPEVCIEPPKVDPCADCVHYSPSSTDGKPCCACDPANPLTNCHEVKEETE